MSTADVPIYTPRLRLRFFRPDDLETFTGYLLVPENARYLDHPVRRANDCQNMLAAMEQEISLHRPGDAFSLAIDERISGKLVGQVRLLWHDAIAGQAEFTLIIAPDAQGRGYGREAARAIIDLGFVTFGFHRIYARCSPSHKRAERLLNALGMRLEAHYHEHALFQGEWYDELRFALLEREWPVEQKAWKSQHPLKIA